MKKNTQILLGLFLILYWICLFTVENASAQNERVFILHSYHQEYPWTKNENSGFSLTLSDKFMSGTINFSTEYLDTKRVVFNKEYQEFFYQYLKEKYIHYIPNVIFCSDDNALNFMLQFKERLFGNVPVVFCGVNNLSVQKKLDRKHYTGVFEKKEIVPNLVLLKEIIPQSKNILFLGDGSPTHQAIDQTIRADIISRFPEQKFSILANDSLEYLIQQLNIYKKGIIFLTTIGGIKDEYGNVVPLKKSLSSIVSSGDFTIISMEDVYLKAGIFGGYVTNGFSQGKAAAELTVRILQGNPPISIPMITESPNQYMFNYPQLKKFGLTISQLPEKSIILNRPHSFYDQYRYRILSAIFFLIFQTIVIVFLIQNIHRRKRAESSLQEAHEDLEKKVIERTLELTETNTNLHNEINERILTEKILEMIATGQSASNIYDAIALMYEARNPGMRCSLLELKGDKLKHGGAPSLPKEYCDAVNGLRIGPCVGSCGTSTYTGKRVLVGNIETDPKWSEIKQAALPHGMRCCWSEPIKDSSGKVLGAFGMYYNHPALPNKDEQADLYSAARLTSIVMERDQREIALRQSENKYRTLVENIPQRLFLKDKNSVFVSCSNNFAEDQGITPEQIVGTTDNDYFPEDIAKHYQQDDQRIMKSGVTEEIEEAIIVNGEKRIINTIKTPVLDENGNINGISGIFLDITQQKQLEEKYHQAQKMESIGNLAGGIAHEFNNILSIIIGNNELVTEELPEWSLARESTEEIRIAGMRARDVVKQLLTFSRQDNTAKKVMDFRSVVQESMKLIRSSIPANIEIQQTLSDDVYPVLGNETQINQLLINLCNNAVDAMPSAGALLTIELLNETVDENQAKQHSSLKPGQYVKLQVSDNGIGMDKETIDRIFEPFYTTKEIGKGSGIGLAVVHGVIERLGGLVMANSQPGQGSIFTLFFSAYEGPLEDKKNEDVVLPTGDECILYVDDEPSIAKLGKRHLASLGYTAESTTDPLEALDMVKADKDKFDLVISDMAMPNMTGDQLVTEILKIRPDMPTIICTGYSAKVSEKEAADIGVSSFAMKPLNRADLAKKVRQVLDEANSSE
jgi:PAS domain S-box-containing protein